MLPGTLHRPFSRSTWSYAIKIIVIITTRLRSDMKYKNIFTILFSALPIYPTPVNEVHLRSVHPDIWNLAKTWENFHFLSKISENDFRYITFAHCNAVTLLIKWASELCHYENDAQISSQLFLFIDRNSKQITITMSLDNVFNWRRLAEKCEIVIFRPFQTLCIVNGQLLWMRHHICVHISVGRMIGFFKKIHCTAAVLRAKFHRALLIRQTAFFEIFHTFDRRR